MSYLSRNLKKLKESSFTGFTENSKFVKNDFVFISLSENSKEALNHSKEAIKNGAKFVISQIDLKNELKEYNLFDKNLKENKDKYLKQLFNRSIKDIKIFGITGTNGKSSTAFFLHQLLIFKGINSTLLSNIPEILSYKNSEISPLTTPDRFLLRYYLKKSIDLKRDYFLMEVSSHGIDQGRIADLNFQGKCLTSFSQDHLDYHKSLRNYRNTKKSFFKEKEKNNVISIDNELGKELVSKNKSALSISLLKKNADILLEKDLIKTPWGDLKNTIPLKSKAMISNILCALGLYGREFGKIDIDSINLSQLKNLPGRLQRSTVFENKYCYVDYAHSPDALNFVLEYLKSSYSGKIITIFGCGGERDRSKRKKMGKISEEKSNFQIITNDNPRNEDPLKIISEISDGMMSKNYQIILDRKEAIAEGLKKLKSLDPNSVLLVAGKGHENSQIVKDNEIHFNDLEVINELKDVV